MLLIYEVNLDDLCQVVYVIELELTYWLLPCKHKHVKAFFMLNITLGLAMCVC